MFRVTVSARSIPMPSMCACCGGPSNARIPAVATRVKGKRVKRTEARAFEFPACSKCVAHVRAMPDKVSYIAWAIGPTLLSLFVPPLAVLMLLGWCPILLALYVVRAAWSRARRGSSCECVRALVAYEGWYGSSHTFATESERFANALVRACRDAGKDAGIVRDARPMRLQAAPSSNVPFLVLLLVVVLIATAKLQSSERQRTEDLAIRHAAADPPARAPAAPAVVSAPDAAVHRARHRR